MNSNDEFEKWLTETIDEDDYDSVRRNRFIWDAAIEAQKAKDLAVVAAIARRCIDAEDDAGRFACTLVAGRITATE